MEARLAAVTAEANAEQLLRGAVGEKQAGARAFLFRRRAVALDHRQLQALSRERNLSIAIQREGYSRAQAAEREADAVFDSVFGLTVSHDRGHTRDRAVAIPRLREEEQDFDQLERDFAALFSGNPPTTSENVCVILDGQIINQDSCTDNVDFNVRPETASFDGPLTWSWFGTLDWSKSFRWGFSANASLRSSKRKKGFHAFPQPLVSEFAPNDPIGIGDRLDWATNVSGGFSMPLPYARNFGRFGSLESVNIDIVDIQREQAHWSVSATDNLVQGDVELQFWALVGAVKVLQITIAQRQALEGHCGEYASPL